MNTTEMLLRENSGVDKIIAIGSTRIYWILFVIGTSRTHELRCSFLKLFSIYFIIIAYIFFFASSCLLVPVVFISCLMQFCRTVWLLLKNNPRIFQEKTYGPIHMAEFQNMCCNENSASMIPCKISDSDNNTSCLFKLFATLSQFFYFSSLIIQICISDSRGVQFNGRKLIVDTQQTIFSEHNIFCFRGQ